MTRKSIFLLALFIYIFVATFTFHPDIKIIMYQTGFLTKGVFNIYTFFVNNPDKAFLGPFAYPPLAYFSYGFMFPIVRMIAGVGFENWLKMGNDAVGVRHIFQYLFALKLPAILFSMITGVVISGYLKNEVEKKKALIFWFFNPISIYVVAFMGQIDILAVLFTVLALYFANKKPVLSSLFLGLGGAVKTYPVLLIPFLAFVTGKNLKEKIYISAVGIGIYVLFIFPFMFNSSFYTSTFVSGLSQRIFEMKLSVGYGDGFLIVPGLLLILFMISLQDKFHENVKSLLLFFLSTTLIVATGVHFHPQWSLWSMPFLAVLVAKQKNLLRSNFIIILILFFIGWLGTLMMFDDKFLYWVILSPLDPGLLILPTFPELIKSFYDPGLIQSLFHTILLVPGFWLVLSGFKNNE